jgi:hypothetical protein
MKPRLKRNLILCLLALVARVNAVENPPAMTFEQFWADAQKANRTAKSEASQQRMDWWRDARFGMFIHWDMSSVIASEISWSKQYYPDTGENLRDNQRPSPELYGVELTKVSRRNWWRPE